ncbi:MAG: hypothetical protein ACOC4C_03590 [Fibrobacterota bacterium]
MIRQKVYIESTVWYQMVNYSSSEFQAMARQLFRLIEEDHYDIYISNIVLEEMYLNDRKYRKKLLDLIAKYKPLLLVQNSEADDIAAAYIENAYKDRKREEVLVDSYHAAIATTANISYVVSYNYRNLLNVQTLAHINSVNLLAGYGHSLAVLPPFMFLNLDDYDGEKGQVDQKVWELKTRCGEKIGQLKDKSGKKNRNEFIRRAKKHAQVLGLELVQISRSFTYL